MIRDVKASSSKWAGKFAWQTGYGAFRVSESAVQRVLRYIEEQEQHHPKMTFQEEYLLFLKQHEVEYDPAISGIDLSPLKGLNGFLLLLTHG